MDIEALCKAAIFGELHDTEAARLLAVARPQQCHKGECLFLLGDHADRLYVVLSGRIELTFPLSFGGVVRDVPVESKTAGSALGWSALVKPHRFTLSARAAETSELAAFVRHDLLRVFEEEPRIGCVVMRHIGEVVGRRLLQMQALWARELQRVVSDSLAAAREPGG
ncbi:MAG: cyclic nucleotide-binding domain-containing protein [Deltaproteobacteria bacterium]|nr:cyclic nucleotide-binding domain-containing protein [Deltaproteobacteria bacterium]